MQLGYLRERRAVPLIEQWLATIGPQALNDVPGGKEFQPSTCYLRHIEALAMIGDEGAIPALEEFDRKMPRGVGFGGFISGFVQAGVKEAIEEVQQKAAFRKALARQSGLEQKSKAFFEFCRRDALARFRLYEDQVVRHTRQGKQILERLAGDKDSTLAASAKSLLEKWNELGK